MAVIDLQITEKLSWLLSKPKRVKIAVGGRGSQKSTGIGDIMLMFADNGRRVCASREFQNSIDDSVHENLKGEIDRLGITGFTALSNEIKSNSGGGIFYRGLARNITSLQSLSGVDYLWIEEGSSVSAKSLKVLTPSIRSTASSNLEGDSPPEIWITMNRGSSADAIAQKYLKRAEPSLAKTGYYEDDLLMVVEINYPENPWFPPELEQERLDDYENLPRAEYDHIWGGRYNDHIENSIIKSEWFDACIDAHKNPKFKKAFEPKGLIKAAHDPSDTGRDSKGFAAIHGSIVLAVKEKTTGEIDEGFDWAADEARAIGADWFIWDGDGMGAGLKRQASTAFDGSKIQYHMFRGSLSGKGQDNALDMYAHTEGDKKAAKTYAESFKNNRAQYYMHFANRCYATYRCVIRGEYVDPDEMISIDSDGVENMAMLRAEVCRIPRKRTNSGIMQIMTKAQMKSLGIDSPNMADALMMLGWIPPIAIKAKKLNFSKWGQ